MSSTIACLKIKKENALSAPQRDHQTAVPRHGLRVGAVEIRNINLTARAGVATEGDLGLRDALPVESLEEIIRVVRDEVGIMAMVGDALVGTMGIIKPTWWYGDEEFLTDRWHFVLPQYDGTAISQALLDEAVKIADGAHLKFFHQGRARRAKNGVYYMWPRIYGGGSDKT